VLSKIGTFMSLLHAGRVRINLDARRPGVVVPEHLRAEKALMLEYGRNLPTPIEGLEIDDFGIKAVLSFAGRKSMTFAPWGAVFRIADDNDNGGMWVDDMPDDLEFQRPVEQAPAGGFSN
jgi:stringent starvation protein B